MRRSAFATVCVFVGFMLAATGLAAQQAGPAAPAALAPADVAAFLGDWTLNVESQMGPSALALSLKDTAGKVTGEISSDMMPKAEITDISKAGTSLILKYGFDYQGNTVPVVVTLAPAADKITASLDFAGGAFMMTGTATKK